MKYIIKILFGLIVGSVALQTYASNIYFPSDTISANRGYYVTSGTSQVRNGVINIIPKIEVYSIKKKTVKNKRSPPPKKEEPKKEKKPEPKKEEKKEKYTPPKKVETKRTELTQAEKEKKAEDNYYATHTKKFTEHAVYDEVKGKWVCNWGYIPDVKKVKCLKIEIPENAHLNDRGNGWMCDRGYRKNFLETGCDKIIVPENAKLTTKGDDWVCNKWYIKSRDGESCIKAKLPPHATQNIFSPIGWSCNFGYKMQEDYSCKK